MLKTTITGSLPRPSWVAEPGKHQFQTWSIPSEYIAEAHDDAVRLAILDQEDAGLDIVTDGEQRRRHYIWGFIEGLNGIDTHRLGKKQTRGGRYTTEAISVARIVGEIVRPRAVLVDALRFAKAQTNKPVKVTLPGPMTIVDSLVDEFYGETTSALARRFAEVLNAEARELAAAGADIIQFDEPCFNIYLEQVAEWGIAMRCPLSFVASFTYSFTSSPYDSGRRSRKNCHTLRTSWISSRFRSATITSSLSRDPSAISLPRGVQK